MFCKQLNYTGNIAAVHLIMFIFLFLMTTFWDLMVFPALDVNAKLSNLTLVVKN